jgi:3-hydroxyacyl-CoA dehydrogenase
MQPKEKLPMKITVVGAGIMGSGIAYSSAVAGFETTLNDVSKDVLDEASRTIHRALDKGVERGKFDAANKKQALTRLNLQGDVGTAVSGAGLIIEAVPESIELKCRLFGELDELTDRTVVLATNTSSLSITEIASATSHPERVEGCTSSIQFRR